MKTLNFLTTGAAAAMLLLGSCTKDVDNPQGGGNGDGGVVEGIPTYATVSLSQRSGAGTYADAGDYVGGNSGATDEEKGIASAAVLVFNQNDVLENYVKFTAPENEGDPWAMTFSTTTGKKRLFAVANLSDASYKTLEEIFKGENGKTAADKQLANICKIIQQIAAIGDATTDNEFYMSNVYPLKDPQTQQTATTEPQVTVENLTDADVNKGPDGDKLNNNFTIYIGRMVAKVTPSFSENLVINSGDGSIDKDGAQYRVRNNPKRFFTFPVYTTVKDQDVVLSSPYFYATYPLPGDKDYAPGAWDDDKTDLTKQTLGAADFFDNTFVAMKADSYLTENSPKDAKRHKVTFLSIKSKWTPDENTALFLANDGKVTTKADAMDGDDFYRIQKREAGKIVGYCPGIYGKLEDGKTIADLVFYEVGTDVAKIKDGTATASTEKVTKKMTDAGEYEDGIDTFTGYVFVKYTGGMAYWAYWMKNSNNGAIAEKYALKRNNHFKVNIISVDGVGEPTEDDNLDKDEDLEADTHMKATIEVLNWNEVEINGGI